MNKFIKEDLHNGMRYTWCGVMNVIADLENNKLTEFNFGEFVPYPILRRILEERHWKEEDDMDTNGWEFDFWITWKSPMDKLYEVSGSFILGGLKIKQLKDETD